MGKLPVVIMGLGLHTVQLLYPGKVINSGLCSNPEHLPRALQGAEQSGSFSGALLSQLTLLCLLGLAGAGHRRAL